ncbi:MAG: filamentous hemagglutinin N-terminal domain-containing protein, partial [Nevskiales bacterium]
MKTPVRRADATPLAALRRLPIAAAVAGLGRLTLLAAVLCNEGWAQTAARIPVNALPTAPTTQYGTPITYHTSGNKATINQTAPTNIVSWKSFDIGSAASVNVSQPSSSAVLLNKVDGGAYLNKTVIEGMLNANGRVYIYNPNGIIFGKTSSVNVDTLIASSLKFDEARVIGGLLLPGTTPVLAADPTYAIGIPGAVEVEGDSGVKAARASLAANGGGMILLAAPTVRNNGVLTAPDGQVMLAAGSKVYLIPPDTSATGTGTSLRGMMVEVSNDYPAGAGGPSAPISDPGAATTTGTSLAENGAAGQINVGHGNATMIGYAVNQNGIVSATTSVTLNGSIYLYARDQASRGGASEAWKASRSGPLVLGPNSVTEVLPDLGDTSTIPASTAFNKSVVKLDGLNIALQGDDKLKQGASIVAPGGNVSIKAERLALNIDSNLPNGTIDPTDKDVVRVDFAPGSLVDVSGSSGAQLAMESNVINVDLRGTELADNVVLRDSPLYATKVNVDVRKGTPIANIAGWVNLVEHGIGELNTAGGTVNVSADGAIIQRTGSKINVDGGYVDYLPGYINTTQLQFNDKLVDIGSALPNTLYTSAVNLPNGPNNFEAGYRQGSGAGTVKFSAPIVVQQGELSGQVTAGILQRDVTAAPQGGQLQIGNVTPDRYDLNDPSKAKVASILTDQFGFAGKLVIGGTSTETAAPPDPGTPFDLANADQRLLASRLDLDPAVLKQDGFSRITALTMSDVNVSAPVNLAPGGHLWLGAGGNISLNAPVTIPGGSLTAAAFGTLQVADGVSLDLAGRWVNDRALAKPALDALGNPVTPLVLNGGTLNLSAGQLDIGKGVSADVSAGDWLDASAKLASAKTASQGKAGSITLEADPPDPNYVTSGGDLTLGSGLTLSGYGFGSGGKLKLVGSTVTVGASSNATDLSLQPAFFQQGGFTSYDIEANVNFNVAANTVVQPQAQSWQLNPDVSLVSSGGMAAVAAPYLFDLSGPARTRPTTSVTFKALPMLTQILIDNHQENIGSLVVNPGAQLLMDPQASLSLLAGQQLTVDGLLNAPAGNILLGLTAETGSTPFSASRSIWFGPQAQVMATGSSQRLYTNGNGISSGDILDGGSIRIGNLQNGVLAAADGFVVAESGSQFSVGGAGMPGLRFKSAGLVTPQQNVASSGGSIEIRAREGLLFAGKLQGGAGGVGASGGSLTVALDREAQNGDNSYPADERVLTIYQSTNTNGIVPFGLQPGDAIVSNVNNSAKGLDPRWLLTGSDTGPNAKYAGQGWLSTKSFAAGGFGRLTFKSQDALAFGLGKSDLSLSASDSLILDAPTLRADFDPSQTPSALTAATPTTSPSSGGHTLSLNAPYIELGSADWRYQTPPASNTGNAQLTANAGNIDLIGNSALQGFAAASLNAKADIRLVGLLSTDASGNATPYSQGSLAMIGNLILSDAQTYPTTLSNFALTVAADPADKTAASLMTDTSTGVLTFNANGNPAQQVLSAAGSLTAVAPHIVQNGLLFAPFGSITLGNLDNPGLPITTDLEYKPGSVTSVAGAGMVPFGNVQNGSVATASDWQVTLNDGTPLPLELNPVSSGGQMEGALPAKAIVSHAQIIR